MVTTTPAIALRSIDTENVEDVPDNEESVRFQILLSQEPIEAWIAEFDQVYRTMPNGIKPPAKVQGEAIKIDFLARYASDLPSYLQFLDAVVERSNEELRRTQEIASSEEHDTLKAKFRETLRSVSLP